MNSNSNRDKEHCFITNKYGNGTLRNSLSVEQFMNNNEYEINFDSLLKKRKRNEVFCEETKNLMLYNKKKINESN